MKSNASIYLSLLFAVSLEAQDAAVLQNRGQEMNNWCWAACSEMILDWDGSNTSQTSITDWAVSGANVGNYLDTGSSGFGPFRVPFTDLVIFRKGVKQVLKEFGGIESEKTGRLSLAEVQENLDNDKPFVSALYWSGGGGHVVVVRDYVDSLLSVEDPWPLDSNPRVGNAGASAAVAYTVLAGTDPVTYQSVVFGSNVGNNWGQTLTIGKALDIVFLIDSTGSMGSYISNVQSQATSLIADLKNKFDDLRIAVVEYRDYPESPYGDSGDFVTRVRSAFTTNTSTATSAINAISVNGGADWPEAVYSAVYKTALGSEIGGWRSEKAVSRHIVLMGDAPGHSPEGFPGGKAFSDCVSALTNSDAPVNLQAVHVGSDSDARSDFTALAGSSGGKVVTNLSASEVSGAIQEIIEEINEQRYPLGDTTNGFPTFRFPNLGGGTASSPEVVSLSIDIEFNDPRRGWRNYKRLRVKDVESGVLETNRLFAVGEYRWRLSGSTRGGSTTYPDGSKERSERSGKFVEETFTTFNRVSNAPDTITKFSSTFVFATERTIAVLFEDDPNADVYAIMLVDGSNPRARPRTYLFKRNRMSEDSEGVLKAVLSVKAGSNYTWFVQGLNYDRKRVDPAAWN